MDKIKNILKDEFISGKKWYDFAFMAFGLALQIIAVAIGFINGEPESPGLIVSGIMGVLSLVLCSQGKISSFIFAYIQILTYVIFFTIPNRLHGETIENGMYFLSMIYGVYAWAKLYHRNDDNNSAEIKAKKLSAAGNVITAVIFAVGTYAYYLFLKNVSIFGVMDSDPFFDSVTSIPAYIAQLLMVLGFREQWIYWLILDVGSIALAARAGSAIMVAQFIFWTINCIYGYYNWTKMSKTQ